MRPQYNTEQLILNIKRACSVPTSQLTYTDTDFVRIANDCLQTQVVPLIMSTREEYFVDFEDVVSSADGVIPMPENAVGAKLRSVCYKQQDNPLVLNNLPRIDLDVVAGVGFTNYTTLAGFYIQGNDIYLYPNTSVPTNTSIRLYYYRRTLDLAASDEYGRVVSVDVGTGTIVLDFVPYDWVIGTELNSVLSTPNFGTTNALMTITSVSSPTIIVDDATGVSVGDYISDAGYSAIPQVPVEAHNYLAQLTAVNCLEGLGDAQGTKTAAATAEVLKDNLLIMISQRVDGSIKKVMAPDGGLRLYSGLGRRGRGWGF